MRHLPLAVALLAGCSGADFAAAPLATDPADADDAVTAPDAGEETAAQNDVLVEDARERVRARGAPKRRP